MQRAGYVHAHVVLSSDESGTWHYGLIARWWAEFNHASPEELGRYRSAIQRFGEPAVDLGCGTGRFLVPLVSEGLDVDGVDVSADMIEAAAAALGGSHRLYVQALHELALPRSYRTAYMCGVFGIGGSREHDRIALRRIQGQLEPGGALLITHWLPYGEAGEEEWSEWLPGHAATSPEDWPAEGNRQASAGGEEIELITRTEAFDPLRQEVVLGMRARLWRGGVVISEESYTLRSCLYFAQEILLMLDEAGFRDVTMHSGFSTEPATPRDGVVTFVARRP